jgi:nicotinamide riboside transporter PnuC
MLANFDVNPNDLLIETVRQLNRVRRTQVVLSLSTMVGTVVAAAVATRTSRVWLLWVASAVIVAMVLIGRERIAKRQVVIKALLATDDSRIQADVRANAKRAFLQSLSKEDYEYLIRKVT